MSRPPKVHVAVVGAGPAGLATAIEAALRGARVEVYEKRRPPLDKACGEGLMPDGLALLRAMGVELEAGKAHPIVGIRYLDPHGRVWVEGRFPEPGAGIRRLQLHRAMVRRAQDLGIYIAWGKGVREVEKEELWHLTLDDGAVTVPDFLVAADGLRSKTAVQVGMAKASGLEPVTGRFGVRRHFGVAPWTDHVEVYWADFCEAYVTPTSPQEIGVALLWDRRRIPPSEAGFDALLGRFPSLSERLAEIEPSSEILGTGPLRRQVLGVAAGDVALVGDASGYVDAITGEGLSIAFHQGVALAEGLAARNLSAYGARCREIRRLPDLMTELLLVLERRPTLRRRVLAALGREPSIFARFLAVHTRAVPASSLLATAPTLLRALLGF